MNTAPDGAVAGVNSQDVQATLQGKTYTLRFSFKAAAFLRDRWGIAWEEEKALLDRVFSTSLVDLPTKITALLRTHHPEVTEAEIESICDAEGLSADLGTFTGAVYTAVRAGWGRPPKKPEAVKAARKSRSPAP